MGLRAKENGKSESRPVMGRIGIESSDHIIPSESKQTSVGSFLTWLQPASEPARREREATYGGPKDEAKVGRNLGIAYTLSKRTATERQ